MGFSNGGRSRCSPDRAIADASGSQGNINDPATKFAWTFNPGNISASTKDRQPVPALATNFSLTITYPGGYTATQSGKIDAGRHRARLHADERIRSQPADL